MKRAVAGGAIIVLLATSAWSVLTVVTAISEGKGDGPVFWTSIAIIGLVAVVAIWLAVRVYRVRLANTSY
jgi:heme/copper-type cytochrome/quinol oxidase subunit 2